MIDLNHCNEWQHRDAETGLVFPWYVKSFLDELVTWELKDKEVLEIGGGASTLWWSKKAGMVYLIENSEEYWRTLFSLNLPNVFSAKINPHGPFDIVIVDNEPISTRDRLIIKAIKVLKPGGKLIIDNWMQPSVGWMPSEETQRLLSQYPVNVYLQEGHPDWKTAVFTKTEGVNYKQLCEEYKELCAKVDMTMGDEQLSALSRLKEIDKQLKQMDAALGRFTGGSTNYKGSA
jgi:predicted O-methyltransferase YrrM